MASQRPPEGRAGERAAGVAPGGSSPPAEERRKVLLPGHRGDYLEAIRALIAENRAPAKTTDIAVRLGLSPPTVTEMVQKMAREGLLEHLPYRGARLTAAGELEAARVRRRRALLERFLAERLHLSRDEARMEAGRMEHAVSDAVIERLCGLLGHPAKALDGGAIEPGRCCGGR